MKTETLNRYVRGMASEKERLAVNRWASESKANEEILKSYRDVYVSLLLLDDGTPVRNDYSRKRPVFWKYLAACVSLAACVLLFVVAFHSTGERTAPAPILINTITSPEGKQTEYIMADGTKVSLNAGSTLEVYECDDKRLTKLTGEAFFDVAHNEALPFIVETEKISIKVFGTTFDVNTYSENPSVVLVSGSVKVQDTTGEWTTISPGQKYTFDSLTSRREITNVEADNYVSWVEGYLRFTPATLEFVFSQLENYFSTPILFKPDINSKTLISGKLELRGGLEAALSNLKDLVPMKWTRSDNNTVTITFINNKS